MIKLTTALEIPAVEAARSYVYKRGEKVLRAKFVRHEKEKDKRKFYTYSIVLDGVQLFDIKTGKFERASDLSNGDIGPLAGLLDYWPHESVPTFAEAHFAKAPENELFKQCNAERFYLVFDASAINFKVEHYQAKDGSVKDKLVAWIDCAYLAQPTESK